MPGTPKGDWPRTKNGRDHRVWLSEAAQALIENHLKEKRTGKVSGAFMRKVVTALGLERATPHDLRRTCQTTITRLGFGRDAMDRVANHPTSNVTDVYDRHGYADEDWRIMAAVARHVLSIVEGTETSNVVSVR
jgi:integrase